LTTLIKKNDRLINLIDVSYIIKNFDLELSFV